MSSFERYCKKCDLKMNLTNILNEYGCCIFHDNQTMEYSKI